jgi:hypothetical protein
MLDHKQLVVAAIVDILLSVTVLLRLLAAGEEAMIAEVLITLGDDDEDLLGGVSKPTR